MFRWTRWAFTITRAKALDTMQRRMLHIILGLRILADESPEYFIRRRARITTQFQEKIGFWSVRWAMSISNWSDHLARDRNAASWPAMLSKLRTPDELAIRRAEF